MKKYRITWYNQDEIVCIEPELIYAESAIEARRKAYIKYGGKNTPGPLIYIEEVQ